ncbi:MAG: hypothetical protein HQL27_00965 [Candidatus Omnitrophica bacterium]|nr:hypothetical protein [Candidatus Omnitrophota bacterium]
MRTKSLCYLSGIDWICYTLDHLSKEATGCGNISQAILCLDRPLDIDKIKKCLLSFIRLFPVVNGKCARALNLAPYWSYLENASEDIPVLSETATSDEEAVAFLHACVNQPFANEREHLRFAHVIVGAHAYASLIFDHRLLDARGAQNFLQLFHQFYCGTFTLSEPFRLERPSGLSLWKEKFQAGQRVNRRFLELSHNAQVRYLPIPKELKGRKFCFRTVTFNRVQSDSITELAYDMAGYLMMAPYFLAASTLAFQDVFGKRLSKGDSFVIPVNTDIRSRNPGLQELFFNHLSFFFMRFASDDIKPLRGFIKQVSRLMYDAMSGGFAQDLAKASLLFRVVPRVFLDTVHRSLMRFRGLSFSFSYVNKGYDALEFCGAQVTAVIHTPRVAIDPGVGIFFTQFNGCISLTFAFLEDILSEEEANLFMDRVQTVLLEKFKQ